MSQSVEARQRLPDDAALLQFIVGVLSHRLPGEVSPERLERSALHRPAPLTGSIGKNRSHPSTRRPAVDFRSDSPLMCKQTAHHGFRARKGRIGRFWGVETKRSRDVHPVQSQPSYQMGQTTRNQRVTPYIAPPGNATAVARQQRAGARKRQSIDSSRESGLLIGDKSPIGTDPLRFSKR